MHGASFLNRELQLYCCTVITDLDTSNGAHRKPFPAATPSWKLTPRLRSKHEKRTAGSAWETWTVAAADGVRFARVRWEINFLLTFETAPFFCVYPVLKQAVSFWYLFLLNALQEIIVLELSNPMYVHEMCAANGLHGSKLKCVQCIVRNKLKSRRSLGKLGRGGSIILKRILNK